MEAPLALYRRYRPETFAEVIGQDHVTAPLRNALSNNRVNHAYLFSGPRGCGKTTSARILARAINCEKGPIAEPCGVCKSCTDLARGGPGSIDVIEIDAASHGGVDDARDLRERAFFAPVESRYKIYIIDEAHMVTTQGFNALLKLVEEPPPHLKFIFATTEPDKVIGTIRSRTHHYPFRLVPPKVLGDYMASLCESEGVAIEPAALPLVVRAGAGSVRDSLSVLDQLIGGAGPDGVTYELAVALLGFTPDSLLDACVDGFAAHDSKAVFETIEKVIETGQDPKRFAEDLLRRLRDLVVLSAVPNAILSGLIEAAEDQGERLQTQAAGIGAAELTRAADIVAAGLLEMRGATAPRLQLELICAKVLLPGADDSTNGIQARLDRMERRLTIGAPAGTQPAEYAPAPGPDAATSRAAARAAAGGAAEAPSAEGVAATAGAQGNAAASGSGTAGPSGDRGVADAARPADAASARTGSWSDAPSAPAPSSQPAPASPPPSTSPAPGASSAPAAGSAAAPVGGTGSAGAGGGVPAGGAAAAPSAGAVGLADIRRLWPEVLEAVKSKRRFAWIMLSQNAQVVAIDDQTLTLGLVNSGARDSFARSGSDEILRQAMIDTIGLNRRVEAVVDPSTDPGPTGGQAAPRPTGPQGGAPQGAPGGSPHGVPGGGAQGGAPSGGPQGGPGGGAQAGGPSAGLHGPGGGSEAGGPGVGPHGAGPGGGAADGGTAGGGPHGGGPGVGAPGGHAGGTGGGAAGTAGGWGDGGSGGQGASGTGLAGPGAGGAANALGGGPTGRGGVGPGDASSTGPGTSGAGWGGPEASGAGAGVAAAGGPAAGAGANVTSAGGPAAGGPAGTQAAGSGGHGPAASGPGGGAAQGLSADQSGGTSARGAGGVSASGPDRAGGGPGAGGSGSARAGQWSDGAGAAIAVQEPPDEYDVPPEPDPWEDGPVRRPTSDAGRPAVPATSATPDSAAARETAGSKRRAAEAAVAAEQARRAAAASVAPEVPLTPEEEADAIGEDDVVLEDDSRSHTDLLRDTLGAQIITEEPNN
ncbi:DNA polymerase III subunit gamma and tau [Kribbella sp. NPDC050820]|uniref:DNA polymerase III subunit gamma and tau n=1 Tax=Kribbella sp. NPDC050820 TaxID=3155408 RepID=UPI0033F82F21